MLFFYILFNMKVQEAVARCLPPLIPAMKDQAESLCQSLQKQAICFSFFFYFLECMQSPTSSYSFKLLEGDKYSERKGAAYGMAGLVKGLGVLSLKNLNIMNTLMVSLLFILFFDSFFSLTQKFLNSSHRKRWIQKRQR